MRCLVVILLAALTATAGAQAPAKVPDDYVTRRLKGFTLLVHREVLRQPADRFGRDGLAILEMEFDDLNRVLVPKLRQLLQSIPVWVRWDWQEPRLRGAVAVYYGATGHEMAQEGMLKEKAGCVEIVTLKRLGELRPPGSKFQQIVTLHEMAHAVHHRLLGFECPDVKAAYSQAMERKLYDNVLDRFNRRGKAYASTSAAEYFAEISCAYLDTCHFYPHNYRDLQIHDEVGFKLAERVWKRPEEFAGRQPVAAMKVPAKAVPKPKVDANAERDAYLKLDRARAMIRQGKKADAKAELKAIMQTYPGTTAALEAQDLLDGL